MQQKAAEGSSMRMQNASDSMATASSAWGVHYEQRLKQSCQRRNRLIEQTLTTTASEIDELFAELDDTPRMGFSATAARVTGEAGDVWYGAQCYAAAYAEQVQRLFTGWTHNMRATNVDLRG